MKTKKYSKKFLLKIIAVLSVMATVICSTAVFANASTGGSNNTRKITVKTKANYLLPGSSSITLKQSKGKYTYSSFSFFRGWKTKTSSGYGVYKITATPIKGKGAKKTAKLTGKSKKISLDKNTTYSVTVAYDSNATWLQNKCKPENWTTYPSWKVSGTWKVSSYY